MTVDQFRKNKDLVAMWAQELRTELILTVLEVMEQAHPARHVIPSDNNGDLSPTRAAIELGTTRGYSMYAERLRLLARPIQPVSSLPEPSYEKDEDKSAKVAHAA